MHLEGWVGEKIAPGRNGKAKWEIILHLEEMGRLNGSEDCT